MCSTASSTPMKSAKCNNNNSLKKHQAIAKEGGGGNVVCNHQNYKSCVFIVGMKDQLVHFSISTAGHHRYIRRKEPSMNLRVCALANFPWCIPPGCVKICRKQNIFFFFFYLFSFRSILFSWCFSRFVASSRRFWMVFRLSTFLRIK